MFSLVQPIVYLSTDAGRPLTAVPERPACVPALDDVPCNGGGDFLGPDPASGCSASSTARSGVSNPRAKDRRQRRKSPGGPAR